MIHLAGLIVFQRFVHRRELMAYLDLMRREYCSGDRERRGAITKAARARLLSQRRLSSK